MMGVAIITYVTFCFDFQSIVTKSNILWHITREKVVIITLFMIYLHHFMICLYVVVLYKMSILPIKSVLAIISLLNLER